LHSLFGNLQQLHWFTALAGRGAVCLRVAARLGAWLAFPGLRGNLVGFARELAGFTFRQYLKKCLYFVQIADFKKQQFACRDKPEEHAGGMPRHTRHEFSAGADETSKPL
jgi:hypothetical protein